MIMEELSLLVYDGSPLLRTCCLLTVTFEAMGHCSLQQFVYTKNTFSLVYGSAFLVEKDLLFFVNILET